ncbi:MAG: hypothetical protein ACLT98_10320 [Eggerthellaceae bacterium]
MLPNVLGDGVDEGAPFCLHSLYGVIVDENDGPHPYSLDNANEWLDAAVPYTFERRETFTSMGDAVLADQSISDPDGRVTVSVPADPLSEERYGEMCDIELSNLRIERSDRLPFGLAVEDTSTTRASGDFAYMNKVSDETLGYQTRRRHVDAGFSYDGHVRGRTVRRGGSRCENIGQFAARDADGRCSALATRALWMTGFEAGVDSNWGAHWHLTNADLRLCTSCDEFDEQADPLFVFLVCERRCR